MKLLLLFTLLFLGFVPISTAQKEVPQNLPDFEYRPYQFGFTIGTVLPSLQLMQSGAIRPQGDILVAGVKSYSPGLNVAVLATLRLTYRLDLRVSPGVSLTNTVIQFASLRNGVTTLINDPVVTVPATYIEMPIVLKYRAFRYNNWTPYLIAGTNFRNNAAPFSDNPIALTRFDWALLFGVGCDFYLPYFRFGLEVKTSIGMNNALMNDRPDLQDFQKIYTRALDKAFSRMIIISLNFE